jgi:PAS domain S-box-containing protein
MEIEVNYLEDNPFLKEEINLINDLGKRLKIIIEQMEAEQKLKESEEKLKKLNLELEQRIEVRTKDLKESEQRYRELYEDAPNAYFTINPDKSIKSCNQAAVELLGYSKEEFQNIKFFYLYYNSPEDLQKTKRLFKQFLKGKNNQDVEIQMKHKNGNPIWVSLAVKPVRNQKGQVIESRTIVRNITERKRTEELIIEENKKLAELNKIKKNLIIRVSHELKTPLNSMYGAIHILMNFYRDRMDKEILEFNNIIYKGCIRLKKLIEDLMDISKLDHSKIILKKKEENISNTLMGCVSEIKHMATQRNLNLIIDLPKVLFIDFDKIRIEQVFINILSNAIKFTPPSGSIFIYLKENSKNIEISVKDTGIGLTRDEMKYLFKRFGKIERYGKQMEVEIEGSGLGLYIAKQIIELHGGDIIVESEGRNKGSTFTIILYK